MAFSIYNVNKPPPSPPLSGIGASQLVAHHSLWFGGVCVCVLDTYAIVVIGRELPLSVALAK